MYTDKLDSLDVMCKFLESNKIQNLIQEETNNLNRPNE